MASGTYVFSAGSHFMGLDCSIRKPPDQRSFAAPRSLSQLTASFIAYQCQGIHHTPLVA
jgi:hypothetical protein